MVWKVEYIAELEIVELTMSGTFTDDDIKDAASARIAAGKENGATRFIIDAIDMQLTGSTFSIYDVPAKLYSETKMERTSRIAVLTTATSASREIVEFYENVSVNRGWNARAFDDRDTAITWLRG